MFLLFKPLYCARNQRAHARVQVVQLAVMLTGTSAVAIVPHCQDPGRLYAYAQLWCPSAASTLRAAWRSAASALSSAARSLRAPSSTATVYAIQVARGAPHTPTSIPKRISLSIDLPEAALRFESHPLERHLTLTHAIHLQTAASIAALHGMSGEYEKMRLSAVSRAAAHRSSPDPKAPNMAEMYSAGTLMTTLVQPLLWHNRCVATLCVAPQTGLLKRHRDCRDAT
jgi:hypothetical protein